MARVQDQHQCGNQSSSDFKLDDQAQLSSNLSNSYFRHRKEKLKLKAKRSKVQNRKNCGAWEITEELKFINFMKENREIFENKPQRRKLHIFKEMSTFMTTRTAQQCRSHHQKYEIRLGSFDNIIDHISDKVGKCMIPEHRDGVFEERAMPIPGVTYFESQYAFDWYGLQRMPQNVLDQAVVEEKGNLNEMRTNNSFKIFQPIQQGQGYQILELKGSISEITILIDLDKFLQE